MNIMHNKSVENFIRPMQLRHATNEERRNTAKYSSRYIA